MSKLFHKTKIKNAIRAEISDIKLFKEKPSISLVRKSLMNYFFRQMYSDGLFRHDEKSELTTNCFIKGFVRDVWEYLKTTYDFVYSKECLNMIKKELSAGVGK